MIVLDLINKIENGEDLPYKIKYKNKIYNYNELYLEYIGENTDDIYDNLIKNINFGHELFNKIEIIEKNKIIEKINDKGKIKTLKINEIIDEINKINNTIKDMKDKIKRGDK